MILKIESEEQNQSIVWQTLALLTKPPFPNVPLFKSTAALIRSFSCGVRKHLIDSESSWFCTSSVPPAHSRWSWLSYTRRALVDWGTVSSEMHPLRKVFLQIIWTKLCAKESYSWPVHHALIRFDRWCSVRSITWKWSKKMQYLDWFTVSGIHL